MVPSLAGAAQAPFWSELPDGVPTRDEIRVGFQQLYPSLIDDVRNVVACALRRGDGDDGTAWRDRADAVCTSQNLPLGDARGIVEVQRPGQCPRTVSRNLPANAGAVARPDAAGDNKVAELLGGIAAGPRRIASHG